MASWVFLLILSLGYSLPTVDDETFLPTLLQYNQTFVFFSSDWCASCGHIRNYLKETESDFTKLFQQFGVSSNTLSIVEVERSSKTEGILTHMSIIDFPVLILFQRSSQAIEQVKSGVIAAINKEIWNDPNFKLSDFIDYRETCNVLSKDLLTSWLIRRAKMPVLPLTLVQSPTELEFLLLQRKGNAGIERVEQLKNSLDTDIIGIQVYGKPESVGVFPVNSFASDVWKKHLNNILLILLQENFSDTFDPIIDATDFDMIQKLATEVDAAHFVIVLVKDLKEGNSMNSEYTELEKDSFCAQSMHKGASQGITLAQITCLLQKQWEYVLQLPSDPDLLHMGLSIKVRHFEPKEREEYNKNEALLTGYSNDPIVTNRIVNHLWKSVHHRGAMCGTGILDRKTDRPCVISLLLKTMERTIIVDDSPIISLQSSSSFAITHSSGMNYPDWIYKHLLIHANNREVVEHVHRRGGPTAIAFSVLDSLSPHFSKDLQTLRNVANKYHKALKNRETKEATMNAQTLQSEIIDVNDIFDAENWVLPSHSLEDLKRLVFVWCDVVDPMSSRLVNFFYPHGTEDESYGNGTQVSYRTVVDTRGPSFVTELQIANAGRERANAREEDTDPRRKLEDLGINLPLFFVSKVFEENRPMWRYRSLNHALLHVRDELPARLNETAVQEFLGNFLTGRLSRYIKSSSPSSDDHFAAHCESDSSMSLSYLSGFALTYELSQLHKGGRCSKIIVMFYTTVCPHSSSTFPHYFSAAQKAKEKDLPVCFFIFNVGDNDIPHDETDNIVQAAGVPTIIKYELKDGVIQYQMFQKQTDSFPSKELYQDALLHWSL